MHPFRRILLIGAYAGLASLTGCDDAADQSSETDPLSQANYPFDRSITDAKGRKIDVNVVGRSKDRVIFVKAGDQKRRHYPIKSLSTKDRLFFSGLPIDEWKDTSHWGSLESEHARVLEKISALKMDQQGARTDMGARARESQIFKLETELNTLTMKIRNQKTKRKR